MPVAYCFSACRTNMSNEGINNNNITNCIGFSSSLIGEMYNVYLRIHSVEGGGRYLLSRGI